MIARACDIWLAISAPGSISAVPSPTSCYVGDGGERYTKKVSSTVDDYARAIVDGLSALLAEIGGGCVGIIELLHGTTVSVERDPRAQKGAKTGLITTRGFRDVLEIRNLRMPRLYDMSWTKPPPLVERRLRVEIDERVNAQGGIDTLRSTRRASSRRSQFLASGGGRGGGGVPAALLPEPGP